VAVTETFPYDGGRAVDVHVPSGPVGLVVFVADGGWHLARLVAALEAAADTSTMVVGVHGMPDDEGRLHEYVVGFEPDRFAAHESFLVDAVVPWVRSRFELDLPASRVAVWGASLGGELALAMGLRHPDVFGVVLSLSPGAGFRPAEVLPSPLPRVYLAAGTQEPFFLENATRWGDALRVAGADVVLEARDGDHGGPFWFEELPAMVAWASAGGSA
jgi:enterochelin esterase-like enzyme